MLKTTEILALLDAKVKSGEITKTQIAAAAQIGKSRVSELFGSGTGRRLSHDEAVRLVDAFRLEPAPPATPLPTPVCRLLARHVASKMGVEIQEDDPRLADATEDLRAFSRFVSDPRVRQSIQAAEGFLQAMRYLRPANGEEAPQGSDPARAA